MTVTVTVVTHGLFLRCLYRRVKRYVYFFIFVWRCCNKCQLQANLKLFSHLRLKRVPYAVLRLCQRLRQSLYNPIALNSSTALSSAFSYLAWLNLFKFKHNASRKHRIVHIKIRIFRCTCNKRYLAVFHKFKQTTVVVSY